MKKLQLICSLLVCWQSALAGGGPNSNLLAPEFAASLRSGNFGRLQEALAHGMSPNSRDLAGNTALMQAAVYGNLDCLRLLLDKGADIDATNAAGANALMRAAFDFEKVRLLVGRGADVHARSVLGNSPLLLAARPANSHRCVELLLAHGADARTTNDWGASALMAAAAGGDEESVRLLLRHGADANAQPQMSHEAFILGGGRSPLMWAAYRGEISIMKMLVQADADVNAEGMLGTPLAQAAWGDNLASTRFLLEHGAQVNQAGHMDGYTPLHWAASSEESDPALVKLLLEKGGDANIGGGANVDAFMDVLQTPLMLAKRRGDTRILASLINAGATNGTPDRARTETPVAKELPAKLDRATFRVAANHAVPLLQETSITSKESFVNHASKQDCVSCHQQFLPMAAIGSAKKFGVAIDEAAESKLVAMVRVGELKNPEPDWEPVFHPDPVGSKGYALFGLAAEAIPADEITDSWVHHLSVIQGRDGRWFNNLPRPPIQTGDVGATALAIHALQRYPLPGRKIEFAKQVERARQWLWTVKPQNNEARVYQILGLAWAGESAAKLQPLVKGLVKEQRNDGGWAQLPGLKSDAYATGQAVYALCIGAGLQHDHTAVEKGRRFLLDTQLADGTWYVRRRAFPFQPTMNSGFPHGKDSWISAAATSWAVLALTLPEEEPKLAFKR